MKIDNIPKIIVGCPIHESKAYCIYEWLDFVCNKLSYTNYEVVVVDNSTDRSWHKQFIGLYSNLTVLQYFTPKNNPLPTSWVIAESQNKIVKFAKNQKADYFMSIECDNFPPADCIEHLMAHQLPIVGGCYQHGFGDARSPLLQEIQKHGDFVRNLQFDETLNKLTSGKLIEIHGFGIGCCLIKMDNFNLIRFRSDKKGHGLSDSYFYLDAMNAAIPVFCDTSLHVVHKNDSWGYKNALQQINIR